MSAITLRDIETLEQDEGASGLDEALALQRIINSGVGWSLQGSYGRSMMGAIKSGRCMLGENSARDYWGNYIPSRDEVKQGTHGSADYVVEQMGYEWFEAIEGA